MLTSAHYGLLRISLPMLKESQPVLLRENAGYLFDLYFFEMFDLINTLIQRIYTDHSCIYPSFAATINSNLPAKTRCFLMTSTHSSSSSTSLSSS